MREWALATGENGTKFLIKDEEIHVPIDPENYFYKEYLEWEAINGECEILPEPHPTMAERAIIAENAESRRQLISGAKARAREIASLSQTASARTGTAWTQPQRVAILDAIGDLAKMLSWLADDMLGAEEPADT